VPQRDRIVVPNTARALALARLLVALFVLYLATSDPGESGFQAEMDDVSAVLYVVAALALAMIAVQSWWWDFRLTVAAVATDFAAFIVIPQYIDPVTSGFLAAATSIAVLIILNSLIRFGHRSALRAAILVNVICYGICILRHFGLMNPPIHMAGAPMGPGFTDLANDLRHLVFLTLATAAIAWFGKWTTFLPRSPLPARIAAPSLEELLDALLVTIQRVSGAAAGTLCWRNELGGECFAVSSGSGGSAPPAANMSCGIANDAAERHVLFDLRRGHALEQGADGRVRDYLGNLSDDAFLAKSGAADGMILQFTGKSGKGRMILSGFTDMHTDLLRLASTLARYTTYSVDMFESDRIGRIVAMSGVRGAIARDLHDSVAQSLAGASYWLRGLMMSPGLESSTVGNIGEAVISLEAESAEIRQLIGRLRAEAVQDQPMDVALEAMREMEVQARRWRISCVLERCTAPLVAGELVVYEIRQILREAVGNAARHGTATHVTVTIDRVPGSLKLTVADDGTGFPANATGVIPQSLAERAMTLGGRVLVDNKGRGALISVFLPGALFR